jgi:beta-lactam-binding protein with PASTA domain
LGTTDASQVEIALRNLGYEVKRVEQALSPGDLLIGQVIRIDPSPGTDLLLGSEVLLIVGTGDPAPDPAPAPAPPNNFVTVEPGE